MDRLLRGWWRLLVLICKIERGAGTFLVALIVVTITVQVITRYVWGWPIVWVEELATYAFLWAVFLGASIGLKEIRHIRIETFVSRLPARARAIGLSLIYVVVGATCLLVGVYSIDIMSIESRSQTMSLPFNVGRHWFYSVPLAVGLFSMVGTAAYFILAYATLALTGRPVDAETMVAEQRARDFEEGEKEVRKVEGAF